MFGVILKSCLEKSTGEGFNKNKNTDKYIDKLLSFFEHFDSFTTLEIYNISSPPLTLLKNHLKTVYKNTSQANMFLMLYLIMVYNNIRLESSL